MIDQQKIEKLIEECNKKIEDNPREQSQGIVVSVGDYIVKSTYFPVSIYSQVTIGDLAVGLVVEVEENNITIVILNHIESIEYGQIVKCTSEIFSFPVGDYRGTIINYLGDNLLDQNPSSFKQYEPVFQKAMGFIHRKPINRQFSTGFMYIDSIIPIGFGQRQLILGDARTRKTTIALESILHNRNKNIIHIYVSIGQPKQEIIDLYTLLIKNNAIENTIFVSAFPEDSNGILFLTPYCAVTLGEFYMNKGYDVIIYYDDLTKHSQAYSSLNLLQGRIPGRGCMPGDIFYIHSQLLERSGSFKTGTITGIPIVETQRGNLEDYIVTNLISITDGQIVLSEKFYNQGLFPPINPNLSVSRIGNLVHKGLLKFVSKGLKGRISQYYDIKNNFGDGQYKDQIMENIIQLFNQEYLEVNSLEITSIMLFIACYFPDIPIYCPLTRKKLIDSLRIKENEFLKETHGEFNNNNINDFTKKLHKILKKIL